MQKFKIVETIMSDHVHIKTPLPIQVGEGEYVLMTFEDLYERCRKEKDFFKGMFSARNQLGVFLEKRKLAMPKKCFDQLVKLLNDPEIVTALGEYLARNRPWPKKGLLLWGSARLMREIPCNWPNCPSD